MMKLQFGLTQEFTNTQYAPLAALLAYYEAEKALEPLQTVTSAAQNGDFSLAEKLEQALISILAGCEYISAVNTKLRPERKLAQLKRITCFADQSTLSRGLDDLTQMNLTQLEAAVRQVSDRCSQTRHHDWRAFLELDFDLSALPCGQQAEGGQKGYASGKKNKIVRQLARVSAVSYHETLWSDLFPGSQLTMQCLQQAVLGVESSFELAPSQRKRTLYRLDGGSGTDENLRWLLERGYHVLGKGFSGKRAKALADHVSRWDTYDDQSWLGWVNPTFDLGHTVNVVVKRHLHKGKLKHNYYLTTLSFPSKRALMDRYNQRGGTEIEQFRADKSGLHLSARRKRNFAAQKALILLTDLAHNLLADFHSRALADSRFADWGLKRIIRDLFAVPGRLHFQSGQLKRIELLASHPYADELIICLEKYCFGRFGSNFE